MVSPSYHSSESYRVAKGDQLSVTVGASKSNEIGQNWDFEFLAICLIDFDSTSQKKECNQELIVDLYRTTLVGWGSVT